MRSFLFPLPPSIRLKEVLLIRSRAFCRWRADPQGPGSSLTNDVNSCVCVDTCICICIYVHIHAASAAYIWVRLYMCIHIYIHGMAKSRSVYDSKGNWRVSSSLWNILWANSMFSVIPFETDKIAFFGRQQCQQNSLKVPCQDLRQRAPCTETV